MRIQNEGKHECLTEKNIIYRRTNSVLVYVGLETFFKLVNNWRIELQKTFSVTARTRYTQVFNRNPL